MLAVQRTPDHCLGSAGHYLKLTLLVTFFILVVTDSAESACRSGYFRKGRLCLRCPTSCVRCTSRTRCSQCNTGRYGSYCQYSCRSQCTSCTADRICQGCKTGYYWSYCQRSCPAGCSQHKCRKSDGYCSLGCKSGYYRSVRKCKICPRHCSRCSSSRRCSECKPGYWGGSCQYSCNHCTRRCSKTRGCTSGCSTGYYLSRGMCYKCPTNCETCSSSIRCAKCRTGFWGRTCQNNCLGCQGTCDKTLGCTGSCSTGYYEHTVNVGIACERCSRGCGNCSSTQCYECVDDRWGSECQNVCDRNCKLSKCDRETGICTDGCNTGYKQIGTTCMACPSVCADCQVPNVCSACRDRHYLSDNTCNQCPAGCEKCSNSTSCTECITGWYGLPTCSNECSVGCNGSICDQVTGECTNGCLNTYYADRCECTISQCTTSNAGNCSECLSDTWYSRDEGCCPCSRTCKDNTCYANGTCKECITGKFGDFCENDCSIQCRNRECDRRGLCFSCIDGFYGADCETECQSVIADCEKCRVQNGSEIICTECIAGKHPSVKGCKDCSQNCKEGAFPKCNSTSAVCKYGCKENWSGRICNIPCFVSHCELCDTSDKNVCLSCFDGFYTDFLATCQECSKTCKQGTTCNKSNGLCTQGCKSGWWGRTCDKRCSNSCIDCDQDNGKACGSCIVGKFGETCDKTCSTHCKSKTDKQTCDKTSGRCMFGCEEGYWGDTCSKACQDCGNFLCSKETGRCLSDCKRNYYGDSCRGKCSEHCNQKAKLFLVVSCDKTGKCYNGCEDNWWGERCDNKCSDHCKKDTCDEEFGRCKFGCTGGYMGDLCNMGPSSTAGDDKPSNKGLIIGLPVAIVLLAIETKSKT